MRGAPLGLGERNFEVMPPRRKQPKLEQEDDFESELRSVYAINFLNSSVTPETSILPLIKKACHMLKSTFNELVRDPRETFETYSIEEFQRDLWRMDHFEKDKAIYELLFDVLAENGMLAHEDKQGKVAEERPAVKDQYINESSFRRGIQRLNQRIPRNVITGSLLFMMNPPPTTFFTPEETKGILKRQHWDFRESIRWEQFVRFLFAGTMMNDRMPRALQVKKGK